MTHSYTAPWRKLALAAMLGLAGTTAAQAQALNYNLFGTSNSAGTYTDLGTSGTVITTPNNDDANSASTPIGFTFNFNGTAFTDFVLNTNGFLKLGTTAPAAPFFYADPQAAAGGPLNTATETNLLLPLNLDLEGTATTEYRVATTGAAGSRVTTIQWKNVSDKLPAGKQFANISFQVKLYETSNRVEFVYSSATAGAGPDAFKAAGVGIKGSGNTATTSVLVTKGSVQAWSLASFVAGNYTGNAHNVRSAVLPDAGRTYGFNPAPANDAAVVTMYALGKTPIAPQVIQTVIRNTGTAALTNLPVTLNVTGANTFADAKIVATLAPGAVATVTFNTFTPVANGTNAIAVTVPADGANGNNTQTYSQQVQATTFAAADPSVAATNGSVGFTANQGAAAGTGIFAVKYTAAAPRTVTAINTRLEGGTAAVGRTVYAVVLDNAGALLGRTPDYVIQTSDIGTSKTFTFATPVTIPAGEFYAGFAQAAAPTGTAPFFPLGLQVEDPTRTGTFYTTALTGGAPADAAANSLGRFMIEAVTNGGTQATSEALNRAIAMYPNPSTGLVKLDVRGANAKGNLQVSVVNMLGQTVHTAALKDNFTNEVNLSDLANGMYLLKVQTGADYTVRQLTITK
ncbi:T9SS type A sorting domain-containing protein [Hymenobacter canadensis]|uniref:T9SS type A sorting domain-containing protein n=1 Tax=Hymenobacter canadensis TaxID=2999067 RepID=A0ABY7LPZ2_9BACT|nr:T9SS type A sorting domain-containing protein [Hymenobacter canadensis]WBA41664.1 T9SS type A sorting domain-containing protein [Hymenobacter canadensis]